MFDFYKEFSLYIGDRETLNTMVKNILEIINRLKFENIKLTDIEIIEQYGFTEEFYYKRFLPVLHEYAASENSIIKCTNQVYHYQYEYIKPKLMV